MITRKTTILAAILSTGLAGAAFAQSAPATPPAGMGMNTGMNMGMNMGSAPGMGMSAPAAPPAGTGMSNSPMDQEMMSGMNKMNQDMASAPQTGNADKDFTAMMIPHHQGAIDMAKTELKYGKDPELRRLATAIIAAQKKEIAEMKAWEAKH